MSGKTKNYNEDFKKKIVELRKSGKTVGLLHKEYGVSNSTINKWVNFYGKSGPFMEKENRTAEQNEIILLKKELKQALMENDILKQVALIMGRK